MGPTVWRSLQYLILWQVLDDCLRWGPEEIADPPLQQWAHQGHTALDQENPEYNIGYKQ